MEFVSFEIAKKLKEKGFREECLARYYCSDKAYFEKNSYNPDTENVFYCYNNDEDLSRFYIDAPTISQVLTWLRKEKNIYITINISYCYESDEDPFPTNPRMKPILRGYYYGVWNLDDLNDKNGHSEYFESPELAALAGIEYVLDNLI